MVRQRGENVETGRRDVNPRTEGRRAGRLDLPLVARIGGGHGDALRVSGRVVGKRVAVVARRCHQDRARIPGVVDRIRHRLAGSRRAQAHTDHLRAGIRGPGDALGERRGTGEAVIIFGHLPVHQRAIIPHPGDAHTVVGDRRGDAGQVGAVAVDIIHRVAGREVLVGHDLGGQVRVVLVDA